MLLDLVETERLLTMESCCHYYKLSYSTLVQQKPIMVGVMRVFNINEFYAVMRVAEVAALWLIEYWTRSYKTILG